MIKICGNCKSYNYRNPNENGKCLNRNAKDIHKNKRFSPLSDACKLFKCKGR